MSHPPPFAARQLAPADLERARELVRAGGAHGVCLGNSLCSYEARRDGELLGFFGPEGLHGLALFGSRGNLLLVVDPRLDGAAVARAVHDAGFGWRIALGPAPVVDALAGFEPRPPLVHRTQLYYGVAPQEVPAANVRDDVRHAERRDQAALMRAALDLNAVDLHVDPRRVYKPWLRDAIARRLRALQTRVIGAPGQLLAKLDIGSAGPFGTVLEGVYTFPEVRGRHLASGLVATVARGSGGPLACLHVAADNAPARRAYERAGMRLMGSCGLLLKA